MSAAPARRLSGAVGLGSLRESVAAVFVPEVVAGLPLFAAMLLPVQATVNAVADKQQGDARREPVTGADVIVVLLGAALTVWTFTAAGTR